MLNRFNLNLLLTLSCLNRLGVTEYLISPFEPSVASDIETSHLIWNANQMTVFYIRCNTRLKWVNPFETNVSCFPKPVSLHCNGLTSFSRRQMPVQSDLLLGWPLVLETPGIDFSPGKNNLLEDMFFIFCVQFFCNVNQLRYLIV